MSRARSIAVLACFVIMAAVLASRTDAADAEQGKIVFERCAACHSLEPGKNDTGPTLAAIWGRKAATEDYRYSPAMTRSDITWDEKTLDAFIEDPQVVVPGNRMAFDGVKESAERANLLEYLKAASAPKNRE
jgi:cytochrome c2